MSTATSPSTAALVNRLARLRARLAAWLWVDGLSRVLWLMLWLGTADLTLDWFFRMDRAQRVVMLVLIVGTLAWFLYRRLIRPLSVATSDDALALQVEEAHQSLGEGLISALQLARLPVHGTGMSPALVRQAVLSGSAAAERVDFSAALDRRAFSQRALLLALALASLGSIAYGVTATEPLAIWFNRNVLLGDRSWPQKTYLVIERVGTDGAVVFPRGEDWTQLVSVTPASEVVPESVYLDFRRARGRAPLAMKKISERQFEAAFVNIIEPFEFRARGGDAVTDWVRVDLVDPPAVTELKLIVAPPKYRGGEPEELPPGRGPYYVLKGSSLSLTATANKPLVRAELTIDQSKLPLALADSLHFAGQISPSHLLSGQYTIELEDTLGLTSRRPTTFGLRQRIDREPRVRVRLIGVSGMVVPQARIPFYCQLTDDFGLTTASIAYRWKGDDLTQEGGLGALELLGPSLRLPEYTLEYALDNAFDLTPLKISAGTGLSFRFEAADNDDISGPNIGRSSEFLLRIVTEEELRTDLLRREKEQRQELERVLKNQEDLLTDSRALAAAVTANSNLTAEQKDLLLQYHKRQKLVGTATNAVAERMAAIVSEVLNNRLEAAGGRLQTRLTSEIVVPLRLVSDELVTNALSTLEKTRRQPAPSDRDAALAETISLQTQTVARLKEILEHMVKSEGFQEAINLLYEIQKAQTDVHNETNKARQDRIQRILEGGATNPGK